MTSKARKPLTFEYDGETFDFLDDTDRWTVVEARAVERVLSAKIEDFGLVDQTTAVIMVSVKRVRSRESLRTIMESLDMALISDIVERQQKRIGEIDAEDPTQREDESEPPDETPESDD